MNTLKLFANVQKYYCSVVYAFVICLYGVITFSIYLNSGSDIAYAYEVVMPSPPLSWQPPWEHISSMQIPRKYPPQIAFQSVILSAVSSLASSQCL